MGPQTVVFSIEEERITVSCPDATRLVEVLHRLGFDSCLSAAKKIECASELHTQVPIVELAIGEDECVLAALSKLRATGNFLQPLVRLERAVTARIEKTS
jgi:hypothetical protein